MGRVEDMGVISQKNEKTQGKNIWRIMQNTKMSKHEKKPNKQVTLMHAHKWNDDKQISWKGVMIEKQRKLKDIKEWTKGKIWNN
jgi:hypothetical protein